MNQEDMPTPAIPVLAIVGHPNKGKSSIVATLAQDASVQISPRSGTTTRNHAYPIRVDGQELCRLVDTPGFQRPRAAMDWMQRHSRSPADHQETVRRFVETHRDDSRFTAECELLTPILAGAGILYVIDGSVPYGPDYDAEMEILRWTGGPSMALINRIGPGDFIESWRPPLLQYFRIVREFNALTEPFHRQVQLLTGFAELREDWRDALQHAADSLVERRRQQLDQAAGRIVDCLTQMLRYSETLDVAGPGDRKAVDQGVRHLQSTLANMEQEARRDIERIFNHDDLERRESALPALEQDLFAEETWQLFGLSRDQLLAMGAVGGAATGALVDIGTGGLSMFLGSGAGALIGAAGAWLGSRQLVKTRLLGLPLGGHQARIGPVSNIQFPWVVLGRAVTHLRLIAHRSHAVRAQLQLDHEQGDTISSGMDAEPRKSLQKLFTRLGSGKDLAPAENTGLVRLIIGLAEQVPGQNSESE